MSTESLKPGANQTVEPGKIVLSLGSPGNALIILHQGTITLRMSPDKASEKNIAASFYTTSLQGPAIFGASSILTNMPSMYYAITETKCVISIYPANLDSLVKIIQSKPQIAILTLNTILKEINQIQEKITRTYSFIKYAANVQYVLGFAFSRLLPEQFTPEKIANVESSGHDKTMAAAFDSLKKLTDKGFKIPDKIDINYLKKDFTSVIGLNYQNMLSVDEEGLEYYKEFMSLDAAILSAIAQKKPQFITLNGRKIAQEFINITVDLLDAYNECIDICDLLLEGQYSWLEKYALQSEIALKNQKQDANLTNSCHFLIESIRMIQDQFQKLWAQNKYNFDSLPVNKINQYLTYCRQQQQQSNALSPETSGAETVSNSSTTEIAKDSLNKILQFSELEPEKRKQFIESSGQV